MQTPNLKEKTTAFLHTLNTDHPNVTVVVATKYATINDIGTLADIDPDLSFGENRVQSGQEKQHAYPNITNPWHFIGHLQRNKVKQVVGHYQLIHSVDSIRLLEEIHAQSLKKQIVTPILLQVNPLQEATKHGFSEDTIETAITTAKEYNGINIQGLMAMAPLTEDTQLIKKNFKIARLLYDKIKVELPDATHLSMGMSNDYKLAIDEGSTMIRIGSILFK